MVFVGIITIIIPQRITIARAAVAQWREATTKAIAGGFSPTARDLLASTAGRDPPFRSFRGAPVKARVGGRVAGRPGAGSGRDRSREDRGVSRVLGECGRVRHQALELVQGEVRDGLEQLLIAPTHLASLLEEMGRGATVGL